MARLLSVNVGKPRDVAWRGEMVHTSVWKTPVEGRRLVRRLKFDGDGHSKSLAYRAKLILPGINAAPRRAPHAPAGAAGSGPKISFARAGLTVPWDAKFQSLLELAEACDVPVRFACRTGVCHTCECGLISGSVKYDPEPLEPPADGNLLICCSRPQGDVAVDI